SKKGWAPMKKLALTTIALTALAAAPAMAADVGLPVRPAPLPPIYVFNWTGCYVGGNGGGVWVNKDFSLSGARFPFGTFTFANAFDLGSHTGSGGIGGVQAGCNYQVAGTGWVFGVQGDYDWMSAKGSHLAPGTNLNIQSDPKSLASVTGRIGYAWD